MAAAPPKVQNCKSTNDPEDTYCLDCRVLVCKKCVTTQHVEHSTRVATAKALEMNSHMIFILEGYKSDAEVFQSSQLNEWAETWEKKIDECGKKKMDAIKQLGNEAQKQIGAVVKQHLAVVDSAIKTLKFVFNEICPCKNLESIKKETEKLLAAFKGNDYREYEELNTKFQSLIAQQAKFPKSTLGVANLLQIKKEVEEKFKATLPATQILTLKNLKVIFRGFDAKVVNKTEITKYEEERKLIEKGAEDCIKRVQDSISDLKTISLNC